MMMLDGNRPSRPHPTFRQFHKAYMADIDAYKDKFSESGRRVLETALGESKKRDQNYVSIEHILHAVANEEDDLFTSTMRDLAVDPRSVKLLIEKRMETGRQHTGKGFRIAPETTELFKRAMDRARSQGRRVIDGSDIFYVLSNDERSVLNDVLQNLGVPSDEVAQTARTRIRKREKEEERSRQKYELPSFLRHFGVSMNKLARQDKIPPTIGREKEILQMIEILSHRERSNSPMLVGEPGVGKTAVVEGLARLIELEPEKVPARLARFAHRSASDGRPCRRHDASRNVRRADQRHHRRGQGKGQHHPLHRRSAHDHRRRRGAGHVVATRRTCSSRRWRAASCGSSARRR